MRMIELKELTKTYNRHKAVDRLSLTVAAGEVFGFIGMNGAGKTTTIKMMGGILAPTEGAAVIAGISIQDEPERAKRKIGFIPDRPYIYEKLTGMEFMRFTADIYSVPPKRFEAKARAMLELFALADWSRELIESYSHGMKQRLIMAAALVHDPEVLIVDEPMVGLDPAAIIMVKDLFKKLAGQGMTIFMSTHTLKVAEDICDRIGVIHRGRLIASGTTADLQREANIGTADLEKVFLNLTDPQAAAMPDFGSGGRSGGKSANRSPEKIRSPEAAGFRPPPE
jgi:ABC-2 type transport system ATP-binding protein